MVQEYGPTDLLTPGLKKDDVALADGRGCPNPPVSVTSINSLIPWVMLPMVELPGSGRMSDRGPAMPARRFPCSTTPCSSTSTCLLLKMWLLSGSPGQEMQRLKSTIVLVGENSQFNPSYAAMEAGLTDRVWTLK
jgi:hypothetical protein